MSVLEWKSCEFYELVLLSKFCKVDIQSQVVAHCTNGILYVFCEVLGVIHFCYKNSWTNSIRYNCSDVRFCTLTTNNEFLVLVAQDEANKVNVHVLNIAGIGKREGAPCVGSGQINAQGYVTAVKACLTRGGLLCISIGLDTGELLLHLSALNLDMTPHFFGISTSKSRIIGIEFQKKIDILYMFVCSEENIRLYHIMGSNVINTEIILDSSTTSISCCTFQHNAENSYLLVGREDAVYCFTIDGRGPCYAVSGKKKVISCLKSKIVILIESEETQQSFVVIMDVYKKIIVFQKELKHSSSNMLVTNEMFCYLLIDNHIYITIEKSIQCKLQILINSNLYELALTVVDKKRHNLAGSVSLKYGDYLLNKGYIPSAIIQYKQTVGLMNPYFIIKKLIESKYNSQLLEFMQNSLLIGKASSNQKELFKNCKLRMNLSVQGNIRENEICCDNRLSNTLLKFLENVDYILKNSAVSCDDDFYIQLIGNCPKSISAYWGKVFRALKTINYPERCISLLIASKENCMEFLEFLVTSPHKNSIMVSLLLELHLFDWQNGKKKVSEIIQFLEKYSTGYSEQVLIVFVNYSFWPGVIYFHEKFEMFQLCLKYCIKYCDYDININLGKKSYISPNITMQTFETINCKSNNSIEFVDRIIGTMLGERNKDMLQISQRISSRKNFKVIHIKKLFCNNGSENALKSLHQIQHLVSSLRSLNDYLSKFRLCPIEFRENICVICKRSLTLPAAYFLCQHAFHGDCVEHSSCDNVCSLCPTVGK